MSATGNDIGGTGPSGTGAGGTQDPRTLERRSDQIRADMNQTLDQLQRQYSPGALLDRGMELFRENGGELQQNLGRSIRENPMPALLTLVGVGWMILATQQRSRGPAYQAYGDVDEGVDYPESDSTTSYSPGSGSGGADGEPGMKEKIGAKASAVGERLRDAKDSVSESMHSGRERMSERGSALAGAARQQSGRAKDGFNRMLEEQPLMVGAIGVAVGAILGALIPESDKEREMLGEARENVMDKARELGQQGYAAARDTATKAAAAVKDATADDREALKAKVGGSGGSGTGAGGSRDSAGMSGGATGYGGGGGAGYGGSGAGTTTGGGVGGGAGTTTGGAGGMGSGSSAPRGPTSESDPRKRR